ncbi:MAG: hypothetical protein JKX76_02680 [Colwellia sp.]|nr:hypothetical protein [Colwellia sp.]
MIIYCVIAILAVVIVVLGILLLIYYTKPSPDTIEGFSLAPRVVVSFTTTPDRLEYISHVANEMKRQTYHPDAIYACIPKYSKRFKKNYDLTGVDIPVGITIVQPEDFGPATKLMGCIAYENDPNTIIITVDDDINYKPDLIEQLVSLGIDNPNHSIGSRARDENLEKIDNDLYVTKSPDIDSNQYSTSSGIVPDTKGVSNLTLLGYGGILYRRKFITPNIIQYFNNLDSQDACFLSDDLTFSKMVTDNGYSKTKIPSMIFQENRAIEKFSPLKKEKRNETYDTCISNLT